MSSPSTASPLPALGPARHDADLDVGRVRKRTTWLLFASQIFGSGGTAAALAVTTILAATILGSSTWAGVPNSVRVLGAGLFSVPLSSFMVQRGRRAGLVLGYAIGIVGGALAVMSAVLASYPLLLLGSAIFGAGYASNMLSRYAAADVSPPDERGKAISLVVWGATVGAVAGPSLIGPSSDWAARFDLPPIAGALLISVATFAIAAGLLFAFLRPDPLAVARLMAARAAADEPRESRSLAQLARIPGVQLALLTLMASNLVMIAIMAMTPVYMHDHGHSLQFVGIMVSAHVVGMYVFSPATGWLADRVGRHPVIVLSALVLGGAAVIGVLAPASNAALVTLAMFLIGLGWNLGFVAGSALLTDSVAPPERPRAQGAADTCMGVTAAIGSLASGPIMAGLGFPALNVVMALTVLLPLIAVRLARLQPGAE